jgi:hypothetical protein
LAADFAGKAGKLGGLAYTRVPHQQRFEMRGAVGASKRQLEACYHVATPHFVDFCAIEPLELIWFQVLMRALVGDYLEACGRIADAPDAALPDPITEALRQLTPSQPE